MITSELHTLTSQHQEVLLDHEAIDVTRTGDRDGCVFSLHLSSEHCTGTVFNSQHQKFTWLRSFRMPAGTAPWLDPAWLREQMPMLDDMPLQVYFSSLKVTLVPEPLYSTSLKESYFKLNQKIEKSESVEADYLRRLDAWLLYARERESLAGLHAAFPAATFHHSSTAWLDNLLIQYKDEPLDRIHIDFCEEGIHIAAFREGTLLIYNSFACSTPEDKIYYVLFLSEQLRFSPQQDRYYLSGLIGKDQPDYKLFQKYISTLKLQEKPAYYNYSLPLLNLPEHIYYKAFCTPVCAL